MLGGFSGAVDYKIEKKLKPGSVAALYAAVMKALASDKSLATSVRRFNSALTRVSLEDKLIDIVISLESIFTSSTEIKFKFSLFNALLNADNLSDRLESFAFLKTLYDKRSSVVHGNTSADEWIAQNWEKAVKAARASLLKKIDYLQDNPSGEWQAHLDKLALGAAQ